MELATWYIASACLIVGGWATWVIELGRRRRAESAALEFQRAQENTLRLLRLSTGDQRNMALTLIGHAAAVQPADPALHGLARQLLDLSDTLVEHTESPDAARFITEERLLLQPLIDFAVAQVSAHLGPSRRAWRIDPAFAHTSLLADRRALNQVIVSVLTGAAAATRDGDWIELSLQVSQDDISIVVQDEGVGLPVIQGGPHPEESRGIGLRLTLARSLVQAHGGRLTVESAECVGTRVRVQFPATRLVAGAPGGCGSAAAHPSLT